MNIIIYTWTFRIKLLDPEGKSYIPTARCFARGDHQKPNIDFNPDTLYAPLASYETFRTVIAMSAARGVTLERADISNAYIHGNINTPVYMRQSTESTGVEAAPGKVCRLNKSIYGLNQAGPLVQT